MNQLNPMNFCYSSQQIAVQITTNAVEIVHIRWIACARCLCRIVARVLAAGDLSRRKTLSSPSGPDRFRRTVRTPPIPLRAIRRQSPTTYPSPPSKINYPSGSAYHLLLKKTTDKYITCRHLNNSVITDREPCYLQ